MAGFLLPVTISIEPATYVSAAVLCAAPPVGLRRGRKLREQIRSTGLQRHKKNGRRRYVACR